LARHRSHGGQEPNPEYSQALQRARVRSGGSHRLPAPPPALRGRLALAAFAAGAFVAAGSTLNNQPVPVNDQGLDGVAPLASDAQFYGIGGDSTPEQLLRPEILPGTARDDSTQFASLAKRAARDAEARRPLFVLPTNGVLTSGFGARWGTMHWGIDLANRIGTPIVAAADGVVVESGPASGFGMWIRIEHADGTITVYGHIDRSLVHEGQHVQAGEQIATMGNRGQSTGPHLHFEVWNPSGVKINPLTWLRSKGLNI
jgi:murein DD-endopeptidase MepM/ murein hydrolase activator NlpD